MKRFCPLFFAVFLIFFVLSCGTGQTPEIACNKKVHAFLSSMAQQDPEGYTFKTREEFAERLKELEELVDHDNVKLTQELICYKSQAKGVAEGMLPAIIFNSIKIPQEDIFWGVMPLLDSRDMKKRKEAYQALEIFQNAEDCQIDFSFYEEMLKKHGEKIPMALIDHMYSKSPEQALSTMANVYMTKEEAADLMRQVKTERITPSRFCDDRDIIVDPQAALSLSKQPEWWIRLYVAKRMQKSSQPLPPDILCELKKCEHPLVVQAVSAMIGDNGRKACE